MNQDKKQTISQEEYRNCIEILDEEIKAAKESKERFRQLFLETNAVFKIGDKVRIHHAEMQFGCRLIPATYQDGYVCRIHDQRFTGRVCYDFLRAKLNGSPSKIAMNIYSFDRMELLTNKEGTK